MTQKVRIGDKIVEKGHITAGLLTYVLTECLNIQNAPLTKSIIDSRATKLIPENICKRYKIITYK